MNSQLLRAVSNFLSVADVTALEGACSDLHSAVAAGPFWANVAAVRW
jgi:hypothetical protein